MSDMKPQIDNIAALAASLSDAVNEFVNGLRHLEASAIELEARHHSEMQRRQHEIGGLEAKKARLLQEHKQIEDSKASLKKEMQDLLNRISERAA